MLLLFKKRKLTDQLQLRNCSLKDVHTMYSGRTETDMMADSVILLLDLISFR